MTNPFYAFLLLVSGLMSGAIAVVAWQRRPVAGAVPLAWTMIAMVFWGWMYAIVWLTPDTNVKLFWLGWAFVGVVISSPAFLVTAIEFTGHQDWLTRKFYASLCVLPILGMLMYVTDPWLGLFFGGARIDNPDDFMRGGLGFGLIAVNGYLSSFSAVYLLARYFFKASPVKRSSILVIGIGTSLPFIATLVSILHLSPLPLLDLTPLIFTLSGIFYAVGLFCYRMMDLAPIGRDAVLENMEDGMLVVDDLGRVVDLNPRARSFLNKEIANPIGLSAARAFSSWANEINFDFTQPPNRARIQVEGPDFFHYDISVTPLLDLNGDIAGHLVVWRDISLQKKAEIEVREVNVRLRQQLGEIENLHAQLREQAIRDSLTGLFNRRYMEETLAKEIALAERAHAQLSVVMIDIDRFKSFNDLYGHRTGDQILQALGILLTDNTRQSDIACRYGGDEFMVVMPKSTAEDAAMRADGWRATFAQIVFTANGLPLSTTLSIGIASLAQGFTKYEDLIVAADIALYFSKVERNKIHVFDPAKKYNR